MLCDEVGQTAKNERNICEVGSRNSSADNQSHSVVVSKGSGVAVWARALTGDRTVNGSSPAAVKTVRFASELWQFRLPRLASVFRMRH